MKLLLQPDDGPEPLVDALNSAKKSIQISIFRCDYAPIEKALVEAVQRGVAVHALIASVNRGGGVRLRGLETRLLAAGAVVARTNTDLNRYHGKYFIVDEEELYVLAYNFTRSDINGSRSFGLHVTDKAVVGAASRLFQADSTRQPYEEDQPSFLVSPVNARERLTSFLQGARKSLRIYDVEISDGKMTAILRDRANAGVQIQIIGHMKHQPENIEVRTPSPLRLHARTVVRDAEDVFVGSQSLRRPELDNRREVGIIAKDSKIAMHITEVFERDWEESRKQVMPAAKVARRVAKEITKELGPIADLVEKTALRNGSTIAADSEDVERSVREAVKTAVQEAVEEVVESTVESGGEK